MLGISVGMLVMLCIVLTCSNVVILQISRPTPFIKCEHHERVTMLMQVLYNLSGITICRYEILPNYRPGVDANLNEGAAMSTATYSRVVYLD